MNTETWFDRAHSVFFDYLVETGILGLLAYLAIFASFYVGFFRSRRRADPRENAEAAPIAARGLLFAMPVAYLIQGVAIFDVLPMYLPLFLFLAFATYYFSNHERMNNR
jgi:O-antigen ligase